MIPVCFAGGTVRAKGIDWISPHAVELAWAT